MRKTDTGMLYSPSDLINFMESRYASAMDRLHALGLLEKDKVRDLQDPLMKTLADQGYAHEDAVVAGLRTRFPDLVEILDIHSRVKLDELTREAMHDGAPVIAQAYLTDGLFAGHADFLVRVETPCEKWTWSYEVWDAKLARSIKPYFIVQLACYSEMLDKLQGGKPEFIVVVTGDKIEHRLRLSEFAAYYRALKQDFLALHADQATPPPDPSLDASHGRWSECAKSELLRRDHLSQVANIRRTQIAKLEAVGCNTLAALAELDDTQTVPRLNPSIRQRLKTQARLQRDSTSLPPKFEILDHLSEGRPRGLDAMPPTSDGDIFFDLEGHPGEENGLEYLWGATFHHENGDIAFQDFWGHDAAGEEAAFTGFIDWAYARWKQYPDMHIYHYAPYEITALRRLMGRTGKREIEVDELLTNEVFVDLYGIVKNGLVIGEPRYSIKNLEHIYWHSKGGRDGIQDGGQSIEIYERWRKDPDGGDPSTSQLLKLLYDYNKEDCDSALALSTWLRNMQQDAGISYREYAPQDPRHLTSEKAATKQAEMVGRSVLAEELFAHGNIESGLISGDGFTLLGHCLEFHRREAKPSWWRFFDRRSFDNDELYADHECLVDVTRTDRAPYKISPKQRNLLYEYNFDLAQPYKGTVKAFKPLEDESTVLQVNVEESGNNRLVLSSSKPPPDNMTLVPYEFVSAQVIADAIADVARAAIHDELQSPAILDVIEKRPPRGRTCVSTVSAHRNEPEAFMAALKQTVRDLEGGTICIQGPPGAGKTYTASHLIVDLLTRGMRIGITSNSHKVVENLMTSVQGLLDENGVNVPIIKVGQIDTSESVGNGATPISTPSKFVARSGPVLVGGTAWLFANRTTEAGFDYLFVDEAGQFSLANLIGTSRAARNLVLLGDQMQLSQPTQGVHPGSSGMSCLDYVLSGAAVIADTEGVFLPSTYRMHSEVCDVISEQVYGGQLNSNVRCEAHTLLGDPTKNVPRLSGIHWHPVEHFGNEQSSVEEAEEISNLVEEILGREFYRNHPRPITLEDILIVTPYNAQKEVLKSILPGGARIGTVDLFQGQEAPVVVISMAASSADIAPRGVEFLFSKNRLNVAVSRAQALAIIVGSSGLASTSARNVDQMRQINFFCRLREAGSVVS